MKPALNHVAEALTGLHTAERDTLILTQSSFQEANTPSGFLDTSITTIFSATATQAPVPAEQKKIVKRLNELRTFHQGDTWYLMVVKWWQTWKEYVGYDDHLFLWDERPEPGPIENHDLLDGKQKVQEGVIENSDYIVVCDEVWNLFHLWYGGGPAIGRKVIRNNWSSVLYLEINPLSLYLMKSSSLNDMITWEYSKADTVRYLKQTMCTYWSLDPDKVGQFSDP